MFGIFNYFQPYVVTSLSHENEENYTSDSKEDTVTETSGFFDDANSEIRETGLQVKLLGLYH